MIILSIKYIQILILPKIEKIKSAPSYLYPEIVPKRCRGHIKKKKKKCHWIGFILPSLPRYNNQ